MNVGQLFAVAELPPPAIFTDPEVQAEGFWQQHFDLPDGAATWSFMVQRSTEPERDEPAVTHLAWDEVLRREVRRRADHLWRLHHDPDGKPWPKAELADNLAADLTLCRHRPLYWLDHYGWLEDPHSRDETLVEIPWVMFPFQRALWWWMQELERRRTKGVLVKSRSLGATWEVCHFDVHGWLFRRRWSAKIGSRTGWDVDRGAGDTESVFGKLRYILERQGSHLLPTWGMSTEEDAQRDLHYLLINKRSGARITGATTTPDFARSGRARFGCWDEFARVEPSIQERSRSGVTSVFDWELLLSTPNGRGNRFHYEYTASPAENTLSLPWAVDLRRDTTWYRGQLIEHGGDLTREERDQEYGCSFAGISSALIWTVDQALTPYDDQDPDWLQLETPRHHLPNVGGMDFGSGPSPTTYVHLLLDWTAGVEVDSVGLVPRVWADLGLEWHRTLEGVIAEDVIDHYRRDYSGSWYVYGDPSGDNVAVGQTSYIKELRAGGLHVTAAPPRFADPDFIRRALQLMQEFMRLGLVRIHRERAARLLEAVETWKWDVPPGIRISELSRATIKWRKDSHSHHAEAFWYAVMAAILMHQPRRGAPKPPTGGGPLGLGGQVGQIHDRYGELGR